MTLIARLRKGIVTSAPYEPQYTVPPAAICFEAADEIERLTHQIEQIKGIESGEMADLRQYQREYNELRKVIDNGSESATHASALYRVVKREDEIERLTAELADVKADRDCWAAQCSARVDDAVRLGGERDALQSALQLIKANTNTLDWPDDINAAIQGEQP